MCRFTLTYIACVCVHNDTAAEVSHVLSLKIYGVHRISPEDTLYSHKTCHIFMVVHIP